MLSNSQNRIPSLRRSLSALLLLVPMAAAGSGLPESVEVSAHVRAWIGPYGPPTRENSGFRMNLGFVAGSEAVAVIDSGYGKQMAEAMLREIGETTDRPVTYVISTNSQPHRILGNETFRSKGAAVVAAEGAVDRIAADGAAMAETAEGILGIEAGSIEPPGRPDHLLRDPMQLDLGGVRLNVIPVGMAHTPGSLIVEVVEDGVVFSGDVIYGGRLPSVLSVSRVDGWIAAYDALRQFEQALFVPGHGEPGKLSEFEHSTYAYLTALKDHMDEAVDRGADMQDAIDSLDQGAWSQLSDFEALAGRNAHQTYLEREDAAFE